MEVQTAGEFESDSAQFVNWLQKNGASISNKIKLADLRSQGAGRGVVTTAAFTEDEELFRIPRSIILTAESSSLPQQIQQQINDPWLSLIAAMVYEYSQGSPRWAEYLKIQPTQFDTLMFWSPEELSMLKGSAVVEKIGKEHADEAFNERIIPALSPLLNNLSKDQLLSLCHQMGSLIMASAFDLEGPEQDRPQEGEDGWEEDEEDSANMTKGMVPLADTLNADADRNNAKLFYEDDFVVMKTIKPVGSGEELFNDYGPLPQADVVRRYGYTTSNYAQYDVVEISTSLIKEAAHQQTGVSMADLGKRCEYLDEQGVMDDAFDIARRNNEDGPFPDELCVVLNGFCLPTADFEKLQQKDKLPKVDLSELAQQLLYSVLVRRRAMYDFQENVSATSGRHAMALAVINGEKTVLQECADFVQEKIAGTSGKRKADTFLEEAQAIHQGSKR